LTARYLFEILLERVHFLLLRQKREITEAMSVKTEGMGSKLVWLCRRWILGDRRTKLEDEIRKYVDEEVNDILEPCFCGMSSCRFCRVNSEGQDDGLDALQVRTSRETHRERQT